MHALAVFRTVDVPVAAYDIALDDAFCWRAAFRRLAELVEVEGTRSLDMGNLVRVCRMVTHARESTAAVMPKQMP